jgi:DNA-binding MarR family transcriptional regulator
VKDRRFVTTTITPEGMRVLAELDEPMRELHREHLGHMGEADLRTLIDLLARARSGVQRTVGDGTTRTGEST